MIQGNTVCNGVSDGIVIGEEGKGIVENNIITGNTHNSEETYEQ